MTAPPVLPDAEARRRIAEELDRSMVVVAGAGTGKTSALVGRVVELVRTGTALREVAVITFTEAAAAELRTRLAEELARASAAEPGHPGLRGALAEVDEAAVSTLHAFAQRILVEHVLAAGLPPGFDVMDELSERVDLEERLALFADDLLDDPGAETMLLRGFVLGLGQAAIAELAWCLHRHWDRLDDGGQALLEAARSPVEQWPVLDVAPVVEALDGALGMEELCTDEDDGLLRHLRQALRPARAALGAAAGDPDAALPLLVSLPRFSTTYGRAEHWDGRAAEVRVACAAAEETRQAALDSLRAPVLADLVARLGAFTLASAEARATEGRLSFHDLLVQARRVLHDDAPARSALRQRYRRLLVDEFQDTDPIQVDLAAWLASAVEGDGDLASARPGALFVVGDPKQSIYRFRRADITVFEQVCTAVGGEVVLSSNFRSVPGVVRFVNTVFPVLFGEDPVPGQASYRAIDARRAPLSGDVRHGGVQLTLAGMGPGEPEPPGLGLPPVVALGGPVDASMGEIRRAAAADVAEALRLAVSESWPVSHPEDPSATARPLRWRDAAVLIPTRNSLPALEEALDSAGIPYRLEGAALLWGSDEVRDVLCTLAAADEPSDAVSVLAALRSPGLACGDDDLVAWRAGGGSWDPRAAVPERLAGHPVARAMAVVLELHHRRWWADPSDMVLAATEALGSYELAFAERRPRQRWQRLRWLADQARLFDDSSGGSLHEFLRWAELQRQGDGRAAILGPPEPDDDAVRIMTVHGAKGLEFPLVVVAGLERDEASGHRPDAVLWRDDGGVEVNLGVNLRSTGFSALADTDKTLDRLERVRLLYVAMTRARDHLVLCLHHRSRSGTPDTSHGAALDALCRANPLLWRRLPGAPRSSPTGHDAPAGDIAAVERVFGATHGADDAEDEAVRQFATESEEWSSARTALLARLRALPLATASALSHEDGDGPAPDTSAPESDPLATALGPGERRRADVGLDIGRAVHGALAVIDFATGCDVTGERATEVARRRAMAHGVAEHADDVARMVQAALETSTLRRAATRRHHKEVYLGAAIPAAAHEAVFEGFADLLVEEDDGLVVVDYKTDRLAGASALAALVERYSVQVAAYAEAAEAATGQPVTGAVLLFLGGTEPLEHVVAGADLARARAGALRAMAQMTAVAG